MIDDVKALFALGVVSAVKSMKLTKRHSASSRRNVSTSLMFVGVGMQRQFAKGD